MKIKLSNYTPPLRILLISLISLALISNTYADSQLIFAIDVIRHGDRTPIKEIPNDKHVWSEGMGELTARGMQQEFSLGQGFRSMYIERYKLLPKSYSASTMYVRSTDYNRTLMSAEAVLMGLYPLGTGPQINNSPALPSQYQPIPIHTVAQKEDPLFEDRTHGPGFESRVIEYVINTPNWQNKVNLYQDKLNKWGLISGMSLKGLYPVSGLGDTLYIRSLYNIPLPKGMSENDSKEILALADWIHVNVFQPYEVGSYASSALLKEINNYLSTAAKGENQLKYVLFSAHDSTILGLMSGLKSPLAKSPPYASDVKFLLFKETNKNILFVNIIYNGTIVNIPECKQQPCTLTEFSNLAQKAAGS